MGKFEISKRTNGEFQFVLRENNGDLLLSSEGYTTKANCINGVSSVQRNAQTPRKYEPKVAKNGKFYYNLKATNGQIIGTSPMYDTAEKRDEQMLAVQQNAHEAKTVDLTVAS